MGLPSKRRTKRSKRERASHFALKPTALGTCPKCAKPVLPHKACGYCGTYKGKQIIAIKLKAKTTKQKDQARREKAKEKELAKS